MDTPNLTPKDLALIESILANEGVTDELRQLTSSNRGRIAAILFSALAAVGVTGLSTPAMAQCTQADKNAELAAGTFNGAEWDAECGPNKATKPASKAPDKTSAVADDTTGAQKPKAAPVRPKASAPKATPKADKQPAEDKGVKKGGAEKNVATSEDDEIAQLKLKQAEYEDKLAASKRRENINTGLGAGGILALLASIWNARRQKKHEKITKRVIRNMFGGEEDDK